ncbi:hypothetical protein A6302_03147 [Methylobrevis pamukkalensis]|uniref:Phage tail assembly chaperone n=2 Tax=Methylobrevis pamukkalensis TaxID=1439726 RepID=A0A1E3GZR2_9HYPH|nr:hypothetical protein A6302_03147 [Methylobrevis pamukkalensis]
MASAILMKAAAEFDGRRQGYIDVPEWGEPDKPLRIWFRAPSMREHRELVKKQIDKDISVNADAVFRFARTGEGADAPRMFTDLDDLKVLMNDVDPAIVLRIGTKIMKMSEVAKEETTGN